MKKVQVNKVREQLAKYLAEAEQGEEIIITKHSKPVAKLSPIEKKEDRFKDMEDFRDQFQSKGKPLSQIVIDMRNEDRL